MKAPRSLPALHRAFPNVFYGWLVASGGSAMSFAVVGVGFYGLVVLLDALVTERGLARDDVSLVTTVYWVVTGLVGLAIGRGVDRFGARGFMAAGLLLMAAGLVWIGRISSAVEIVPAYVLLALGFSMAGAIPNGAIITRWFVAKRARAMTLSHTGVSLGGVLLVPLMTGWIQTHGLTVALDRIAAMLLLMGLPIVIWVLRFDPHDFGLEPDDGETADAAPSRAVLTAQARVWRRSDILRSPSFQILAAAYALMLLCQVGYSMHQLAFLRERMEVELAAWGVSAVAFGSFSARLVLGPLADRLSKRRMAAGLFVFQAAMIVVLANAERPAVLLGASLGFGFTVGTIFMLQALLVGELFGRVSFATAMGLQQVVSQVASGLGPAVLGLLATAYGGYSIALHWLAAGALIAAVLILGVRIPEPAAAAGAIRR